MSSGYADEDPPMTHSLATFKFSSFFFANSNGSSQCSILVFASEDSKTVLEPLRRAPDEESTNQVNFIHQSECQSAGRIGLLTLVILVVSLLLIILHWTPHFESSRINLEPGFSEFRSCLIEFGGLFRSDFNEVTSLFTTGDFVLQFSGCKSQLITSVGDQDLMNVSSWTPRNSHCGS